MSEGRVTGCRRGPADASPCRCGRPDLGVRTRPASPPSARRPNALVNVALRRIASPCWTGGRETRVVLVVGAGRRPPIQGRCPSSQDLSEVGVLTSVADVLLAEAARSQPRLSRQREGQRPEELRTGAASGLATIQPRAVGVRVVERVEPGKRVALRGRRWQVGDRPLPHGVGSLRHQTVVVRDQVGCGEAVDVQGDHHVAAAGESGVDAPVASRGQGEAGRIRVDREHPYVEAAVGGPLQRERGRPWRPRHRRPPVWSSRRGRGAAGGDAGDARAR